MAQVKGRQMPISMKIADPGTLVTQQVYELFVNVLPELPSGGDTLWYERRVSVRHRLKRGRRQKCKISPPKSGTI